MTSLVALTYAALRDEKKGGREKSLMSTSVESKELLATSCCGCDGVKAPGVVLVSLTLQGLRLCIWGSKRARVCRPSLEMRRSPGLGGLETRRPVALRMDLHVGQEPWAQ